MTCRVTVLEISRDDYFICWNYVCTTLDKGNGIHIWLKSPSILYWDGTCVFKNRWGKDLKFVLFAEFISNSSERTDAAVFSNL